MPGSHILVLTTQRQTRRQIARALGAGGLSVDFVELPDEFRKIYEQTTPALTILDCDNSDPASIEATIAWQCAHEHRPPVVILSVGADKAPLLDLVQRHDVANLVAKHGAIRAVYPVLDERELLVTVEKVLRRNIFGIDKYVSSWGVVLHRELITSMSDKFPFLVKFEKFIVDLDTPTSVVPQIVTVAEELILNAVVHAPVTPEGEPKYEHLGAQSILFLEPQEFVEVVYGCDGQRLMLSVSDNFGKLRKRTLYDYLSRGFDSTRIEAESKPGGAGLGLSLSFRSIHQLVFNIQDQVRTEVIAGWYLRVSTASEFRQVGKSLNLFWLPKDSQPVADESTFEKPEQTQPGGTKPATSFLSGRIDETTSFDEVRASSVVDLRDVTAITSRGLLGWLKFVRSVAEKRIELVACPEAIVRLAVEVAGVLEGVVVRTVLAPYECSSCSREELVELAIHETLAPPQRLCTCGGQAIFAGDAEQYRSVFKLAS
jgi:CheY-like chemotaxis protein